MNSRFLLGILAAFSVCQVATAHHPDVHRRIMQHAGDSALALSSAFSGFWTIVSLDCDYLTGRDAMMDGSAFEDHVYKDEGGFRNYGHFYDPFTENGLANYPLDHDIPPLGPNSFIWASARNCPGSNYYGLLPSFMHWEGFMNPNSGTYNKWSWQNARDHQLDGLTLQTQEARHEKLTNMFRALGQVTHLLQDTTSPQHVRNEQHVPGIFQSSFEGWGKKHLNSLVFPHNILNWRNAGFKKLEDFWDTKLYDGMASSLNADAKDELRLGLAEFSNGNFLGDRHVYAELMLSTTFRFGYRESVVEEVKRAGHYPYPSRDTSTNYKQVKADPREGARPLSLRNNAQVEGIYISKTGDGIPVAHHSRINYLGAKLNPALLRQPKPFCSITDDRVMEDYHAVLLPKAVEYSAGLVDYYFRGRFDTMVTANTSGSGGTLQLDIKNKSGQKLKGGVFRLFYDESDGDRTELTSTGNGFVVTWNSSTDTLNDNATLTATFTPPTGVTVTKYTLVYKGTIGIDSNNAAEDTVDEGIAIAAATIILDPRKFYWKFDEPGTVSRVDSVNNVAMDLSLVFPYVTDGVPKQGDASLESVSYEQGTLQTSISSALEYQGNGVSVVGWCRIPIPDPDFSLQINYYLHSSPGTVPWQDVLSLEIGVFNAYLATWSAGFSSSVFSPVPTSWGDWFFFWAGYDPVAGKLSIRINDGPVVETAHPGLSVPTPPSYGQFEARLNHSTPSPGVGALDEVALFLDSITPEQAEFIYNNGVGMTWPFLLPQ